jgi:hypothetical protein
MDTRKILYSPGFGAGFVSWASGSKELKQWMLTYKPFIDALEQGKEITSEMEDAFQAEAKERFGEDSIYMGGVRDLTVATVTGRVQITEYDGSESYVEEGSDSETWL